jgi:cob(I)alamin adenosyltransferase
MKIYTRQGDDGQTGLWAGDRVRKDDLRIEANGSVDELNAALGVIVSKWPSSPAREVLLRVQDRLFCLGADLADPNPAKGQGYLKEEDVEQIEKWIDRFEEELPALKNFILPGGCPASAALHWARTVCRRAERRIVALAGEEPAPKVIICYLNRLGDLLFVLARWVNQEAGGRDRLWRPE